MLMKAISLLLLALCRLGCVQSEGPVQREGCPENFFAVGEFRFMAHGPTRITRSEAAEECSKLDSYLIEPRNEELQKILEQFEYSWIGASDILVEGNWTWESNGQPLTYTNWGPSQPNNYNNQDCAMIRTRGYWDDVDCEDGVPFVCQTEKRPITTTTTKPTTTSTRPTTSPPVSIGSCGLSEFGCCQDQTTSAEGPRFQGCPTKDSCSSSEFGCCPDRVTHHAKGPDYFGCPEAVCRMPKSEGPCKGELDRFYFNDLSMSCESLTYGGCPGNDNNFLTREKCERVCVKMDYSCEYGGQRYKHGENFTVDCNTCSCDQSIVRCTQDQCADSCPANWVRYGDFCFSIDYSRRYTYGKAEKKCRETPGASVVTPQTPEQNKQLQEAVDYFRPDSFWLGMKAVYRWNDGTDLQLWNNWMKASTLRLCVRITPKIDRFRWLPISCGVRSFAICQIPVKETV